MVVDLRVGTFCPSCGLVYSQPVRGDCSADRLNSNPVGGVVDIHIEGNDSEGQVEGPGGAERGGSSKVRNMTCEMNGNWFKDSSVKPTILFCET